jgi:hypothetical protein
MPFVSRADNGEISALHEAPTATAIEYLENGDAEVQHFIIRSQRVGELKQDLLTSDTSMARVLEDLIDALIRKGVIAMGDLPPPARNKLEQRHRLRTEIRDVPVIQTDDLI